MTGLVVNPFLNVSRLDETEDAFVLSVPTRNEGLKSLIIERGSEPDLYEVLLDFSQIGFTFLDVEKDLGEKEKELLFRSGVIVEDDKKPEEALFSCLLNDVPAQQAPSDNSLIVNPTFRFSSLDIANIGKRFHGEHLSGRPSAWVADEVTGIERGYWFTDIALADIVSRFQAGRPVPPIDKYMYMLARLYAAGIVTTVADIEERTTRNRQKIEMASTKYSADRYAVIRELLPLEQMAAMRAYYRKYIGNGFMPITDRQSHRYYQHNEPLARLIHKQLTKVMCEVTGVEVIPSYVYAASYIPGADLKPHTDRAQCEYSISFQVDYQPEPEGHISPWGLFVWRPEGLGEGPLEYVSDEFPAASQADDTNTAVYLASGDGLVYKGRELIHYRYPLPAGHTSTSLFFHYVAKDFDGDLS